MKTSAIKKILLTISLFFLVALIKVNAAPDPLNPAPGGAVYTFGGNPSSYRNVSCSVNSSTKDGASTPNLINLAGRASNASGTLGSFSGYLEVDEVELKTSAGMTEAEKNNFISLLHSGIII